MNSIATGLLLSGVLLVSLVVLLLTILLSRKLRKVVLVYAVGTLLIFGGAGSWTAYLLARNSYRRLAKAVQPRTGPEIYAALFKAPATTCVRVMQAQDQVVPKIDYAIWLEFTTCPTELRRVLSLHPYVATKEATYEWNTTSPAAGNNWFRPESLGDTVLVFRYRRNAYGSGQTIFAALDSTKAYCQDASE